MNRTYIADVGPVRFFLRTLIRQVFKRILRRGVRFRLPTGLTMHLPRDSAFGSEIFVTGGQVDRGAEELFTRSLDADRDVIDAGANIGYYAMYVAPHVNRVWAFEPDPRTLPALTSNASRAPNIEVIDRALLSSPGEMSFDISGRHEVSALVDAESAAGVTIKVAVDTIDGFVAANPAIAVTGIKIDVEGNDMAVLKGARETLARDQPLVLTEFNVGDGSANSETDLVSFAADISYTLFGFIRLSGAAAPRYKLRRLGHGGNPIGDSKMIFMVPSRLQRAFEAEIS